MYIGVVNMHVYTYINIDSYINICTRIHKLMTTSNYNNCYLQTQSRNIPPHTGHLGDLIDQRLFQQHSSPININSDK
jgi:hypothetical protein